VWSALFLVGTRNVKLNNSFIMIVYQFANKGIVAINQIIFLLGSFRSV